MYNSFQCPDFTWNAMPTGTYSLGFSEQYRYQVLPASGTFHFFGIQSFVLASPTTTTVFATTTASSTTTLDPYYSQTTTLTEVDDYLMLTTLPAQPASTAMEYITSTETVDTSYSTTSLPATETVTNAYTSISTSLLPAEPSATSIVTAYSNTVTGTVYQTVNVTVLRTVTDSIQSCPAVASTSLATSVISSPSIQSSIKTISKPSSKTSLLKSSSSPTTSSKKSTTKLSTKVTTQSTTKVSTKSTTKASTKTSSRTAVAIPTPSSFVCPSNVPKVYTASTGGNRFEIECLSTKTLASSAKLSTVHSSTNFAKCMASCKGKADCYAITYIAASLSSGDCYVSHTTSKQRRRIQRISDPDDWSSEARDIWNARLLPRQADPSTSANGGGPDATYPPIPTSTVVDSTTVTTVTRTALASLGTLTRHATTSTTTTATVTPSPSGVTSMSTVEAVTGFTTIVSQVQDDPITVESDTTTTTVASVAPSGVSTQTIQLQATSYTTVTVPVNVTQTVTVTTAGCFPE
ncbi:hypothetical protein MBLNU459_g0451t1 [Dothideomycetes sp. NU459]